MAGQVNWPGTEVTPQSAQPGTPTFTQTVPPTPSQAPGQTAGQVEHQRLENIRLQQQIAAGSDEGAAPSDDPIIRSQAQALVEGRIPYPRGRAATDPHNQQIIATAFQIDPNFDETAHALRQAAGLAFTGNGRGARTIGSARRIAHHLADLSRASDELAGPDIGAGPLNTLAATVGQVFEPTAATTYDTAAGHIAQELQGYFRQGTGTGAEIERDIQNMGRHQSLDSRRAAIHELVSLIAGGVQPLQDQYNSAYRPGSPRPQIPWFNAEERRIYQDLGGVDFSLGDDDQRGNSPVPGAAAPAVGGAPGGSQGGPPIVNAPQIRPSGGPGFEAASSDTPPTQVVTPEYIHMAGELQGAFDHGATREQMDALAQRRGLPPFSADLDAAIAYRDRGGRGARILPPETMTPAGARAAQYNQQMGREGAGALLVHGATLGLTDEAGGVGGALENVLGSPFTGNFDPIGAYQESRDAERIRLNEARDSSGWGGTAAEILGSLASVNPAEAVETVAPTLMGRMGAGARGGATIGGVSGFGHGNGLGGSIRGAAVGAAEGAGLGLAAPVVGATVRGGGRLARGAYRTVMGENRDLSRRIVAQAIQADDASGFNPIARVSGQLADAHANDVPAMLADTGDNARGLLAASARAPGPSRTAARDALDARQAGMAGRVTDTIERDLGPVSNPHEVADTLMTQARDTAAPLYDSAYAAPGADTFAQRAAPLLARPSMQRALSRAVRIAQEEGRDPTTAGFDVNSSGEVTISRTPSWQTLDYVKRGLDDVIEQYRDPTSGRLNLDTEGRAINNTQRTFLRAFDQANPNYAAARSAYGGPVRGIDAINQGRQALSMTADDLEARMRDMTPYERQMFQLGTRRAMAELVASKGDSADVVNALVGTGKKRAMLARLFGDRQSFQRFIDTLGHEQEAFRTFRAARLGSPTASNLQDDNALRDAATEGATDLVLNGGTGILPSALKFVTSLGRRRLDENTAKEVTALLSESDPARIRELATELRQEQTRQAVLAARRGRGARRSGVVAGAAAGRAQER